MKRYWHLVSLLMLACSTQPAQARPAIDLAQLQQICLQSYTHCVEASDAALTQIQPRAPYSLKKRQQR